MEKKVYKKLAQYIRKCPRHDKVLFRTKAEAREAVKNYRKNHKARMQYYYCSEYIGFHIGHSHAFKGRKSGKKKNLYPRIK